MMQSVERVNLQADQLCPLNLTASKPASIKEAGFDDGARSGRTRVADL
jgi:hypothetical protein